MFEDDIPCPKCKQYKVLYYPFPDEGVDCHYCDETFSWEMMAKYHPAFAPDGFRKELADYYGSDDDEG